MLGCHLPHQSPSPFSALCSKNSLPSYLWCCWLQLTPVLRSFPTPAVSPVIRASRSAPSAAVLCRPRRANKLTLALSAWCILYGSPNFSITGIAQLWDLMSEFTNHSNLGTAERGDGIVLLAGLSSPMSQFCGATWRIGGVSSVEYQLASAAHIGTGDSSARKVWALEKPWPLEHIGKLMRAQSNLGFELWTLLETLRSLCLSFADYCRALWSLMID
jgi:hypothetical protein